MADRKDRDRSRDKQKEDDPLKRIGSKKEDDESERKNRDRVPSQSNLPYRAGSVKPGSNTDDKFIQATKQAQKNSGNLEAEIRGRMPATRGGPDPPNQGIYAQLQAMQPTTAGDPLNESIRGEGIPLRPNPGSGTNLFEVPRSINYNYFFN